MRARNFPQMRLFPVHPPNNPTAHVTCTLSFIFTSPYFTTQAHFCCLCKHARTHARTMQHSHQSKTTVLPATMLCTDIPTVYVYTQLQAQSNMSSSTSLPPISRLHDAATSTAVEQPLHGRFSAPVMTHVQSV